MEKRLNKLKIAIFLIALAVIGVFAVSMFYGNRFQSNGERIYFTGTSNSDKPIIASIGNTTIGVVSCARCHGDDGKGKSGRFMTWEFEAPDIRYSTLTTTSHAGHEGHEEGGEPYTEELIKRAITQGLNSEGKHLEPPMPVFQISESDLNDLLEYLKSVK